MHTAREVPASQLIEAEYFFYDRSIMPVTELGRIHAMRGLIRAILEFAPDLIYLRYGAYIFPAHHLAKIAPLVEEINTNDLIQHEDLGGIYNFYNRLTRGILLRRVSGIVTVSHELANSNAFAAYRKPTCVIANGIHLRDFDALPAPSNNVPRLVFIGTPGCFWHGVDKIVKLAWLLPDVKFDVIGYHQIPGFDHLPENVILHGYLALDDYRNVLASADAAISSLALHRISLEEASPLKSRECLAFGLPLILAHTDTDLDDLKNDFLLKIPNTEDNVETQAHTIREFAYRIRTTRVPRDQITRIDLLNKERKRIDFFNELLLNNQVFSQGG